MASQCSGSKKNSKIFVYNFNEKWENEYFFVNAKTGVCI